jgi:hypothetical protein
MNEISIRRISQAVGDMERAYRKFNLCEIHLLVPEGKEVETILEVQAKV